MSKGHHDTHEEPAALPEAAHELPETPPAPTLEERVARLEAYLPRLEALLGPVAPASHDQPPAG